MKNIITEEMKTRKRAVEYAKKYDNVNVNIKMYKSDKIKMYNYSKLT